MTWYDWSNHLFKGCRFINVQVSSLTDKWYGESQKLAAALFSLVSLLQTHVQTPCIYIHLKSLGTMSLCGALNIYGKLDFFRLGN